VTKSTDNKHKKPKRRTSYKANNDQHLLADLEDLPNAEVKPPENTEGRRVEQAMAAYSVPSLRARPRLVTIQQAAESVNKTTHNIRDYIQRGRITKYNPKGERVTRAANGELRVDLNEVEAFLRLVQEGQEHHHHEGLHADLGFYGLPERLRTKHVHRLHPYLGKFIPQLVEWFLTRYFRPDDVIFDPFMGSGTTLVQANEQKMHAMGIDISEFNCRIARVKTQKYDPVKARSEILDAEKHTQRFSQRLIAPSPALPLFTEADFEEFKRGLIDECQSDYLRTWFAPRALLEILYYRRLIETKPYQYKDLLRVLLSRATRSSRLVPHNDLANPKSPLPVGVPYWCNKHKRMCMPIDNAITKIHAYSEDTARRIAEFDKLRSDRSITIIQGDSRTVDLTVDLRGRKVNGIFTSPPYVGQIDYHDQHIYAYELFGVQRNDSLEIGPKAKGKSQRAQADYIQGIADALRNVKQFLADDAKVFIVANDKFNLYPEIARRAGFRIVETFHRAVTKRTEKGDDPYQESIFQMARSE
jgi:DNA modification methylase